MWRRVTPVHVRLISRLLEKVPLAVSGPGRAVTLALAEGPKCGINISSYALLYAPAFSRRSIFQGPVGALQYSEITFKRARVSGKLLDGSNRILDHSWNLSRIAQRYAIVFKFQTRAS